MGGIVERFVKKVRRIVGLPDDPGKPPSLMHMALCWAKVVTQNADGTVELQPADSRYSGEKNVALAAPFPNTQVKVQQGALVILAWAYGDPAQKFALPIWGAGSTLVSASIGSPPDAVVTKTDLSVLLKALNDATVVAQDGGASLRSTMIAFLTAIPPLGPGWTIASSLGTQCGSGVVGVQR